MLFYHHALIVHQRKIVYAVISHLANMCDHPLRAGYSSSNLGYTIEENKRLCPHGAYILEENTVNKVNMHSYNMF